MKFVDEATIYVEGGIGGNGCISFRREKFVPRGGPDGGDGGDGGSVYLIGERGLQTLYDLRLKPHYKAGRGMHGKGKGMDGRSGEDRFIPVPLGIEVYKEEKFIGEILEHKQTMLVARGGKGGRGNRHFVTSTNQTPRIAESGKPGEKCKLKIILKLISQIGIVGFPNAGKSTLLQTMTNARPEIADYPFTTLTPNLGVLKDNFKNIVIADMPGIIEGAHTGKGLGTKFLRHIERTRMLILLIDISSNDPMNQYHILLNEFKNYNPKILKKPRIVVFNKIDLLKKIPEFHLKERTFYISALKNEGIDKLTEALKNEDLYKDR
uniref:GTPase Obg n=1 Tax=candidate division WOR-3 bacterium TaxID=2052148 RepID=A0A7C6AG54_UNCW3